jgi:uncharacterized protein YjaG (DUF416 family)
MKTQDLTTMSKVHSLVNKMSAGFIDYCNVNNINLIQWYRWQLHLIWEQRNLSRIQSGYFQKSKRKIKNR